MLHYLPRNIYSEWGERFWGVCVEGGASKNALYCGKKAAMKRCAMFRIKKAYTRLLVTWLPNATVIKKEIVYNLDIKR